MAQSVLISFVGERDPVSTREQNAGEPGPILTLLGERSFNRVVLLHNEKMRQNAEQTASRIKERYPDVYPVTHPLGFTDPSDHLQILAALRPALQTLEDPKGSTERFICLSSGAPAMHASLLLLAASGEIDARILHIVERRFRKEGESLVREINPRSREFPTVMPRTTLDKLPSKLNNAEIHDALAQSGIVGNSKDFKKVLQYAVRFAPSDESVLISGPNGSGKELLAKFIHWISNRRNGHFSPVNCGAIPESLAESELFGHVKGAFTGANASKDGYFVQAHTGTLFLDEVGELPLTLQPKLLRVLQDGKFKPVGGTREINPDVRIIAATNRDLKELVARGNFREDLYHRLATLTLSLPSLAERRTDIPLIARHIMDKISHRERTDKRLTREAEQKLMRYTWPGNIRELENVLNRSYLLTDAEEIGPDDLSLEEGPIVSTDPILALLNAGIPYMDVPNKMIRRALKEAGGVQAEAARILGVKPQNVNKYVKKYGHDPQVDD